MYLISIYETKRGVIAKGLEIDSSMFKTSRSFAVGALIICDAFMDLPLYTIYW